MTKKQEPRFVLNLKLKTQPFQEDILNKRFEIGRHLYNSVLGLALKRYKEMYKTKRWRENQQNISEIYKKNSDKDKAKKLCKPYFNIKNEMLKEFRLNEYSLHQDVAPMQRIFKKNIDAFTSQKIATRVWKAIDDNIFGKGEEVHFKGRNNPLNSLEGKSNGTGIVYDIKNNVYKWLSLTIPVQLDINNMYEVNALRNEICFCRIERKFVRGKYKYILQIVLKGIPPLKINKQTGEIKNDIGKGVCGGDIGTQTIAYSSRFEVKLLELAPRVQNIENVKRRIQRYMNRSKRATNPQNSNENGTIKKGNIVNGKKEKLVWNFSKKYIKAKNELRDIQRKQADIREQDHNIMSNDILRNCDTFYVENMNYAGLQKRSKKTEKNDKGKFKKKKRFGKSLANKAPAKFLTILKNKLKSRGGLYIEINTREAKASQYNHLNHKYNKKKLSQRWNELEYNGKQIKIQRDLYSAFLIQNTNDDLKSFNNELCNSRFDNFIIMHDIEMNRLSNNKKNLSSMGI